MNRRERSGKRRRVLAERPSHPQPPPARPVEPHARHLHVVPDHGHRNLGHHPQRVRAHEHRLGAPSTAATTAAPEGCASTLVTAGAFTGIRRLPGDDRLELLGGRRVDGRRQLRARQLLAVVEAEQAYGAVAAAGGESLDLFWFSVAIRRAFALVFVVVGFRDRRRARDERQVPEEEALDVPRSVYQGHGRRQVGRAELVVSIGGDEQVAPARAHEVRDDGAAVPEEKRGMVHLAKGSVLVVGAHRIVRLAIGEDDVNVAVLVGDHQVRSLVVVRERSGFLAIVPSADALVRVRGSGEEPHRLIVGGGGEESAGRIERDRADGVGVPETVGFEGARISGDAGVCATPSPMLGTFAAARSGICAPVDASKTAMPFPYATAMCSPLGCIAMRGAGAWFMCSPPHDSPGPS